VFEGCIKFENDLHLVTHEQNINILDWPLSGYYFDMTLTPPHP